MNDDEILKQIKRNEDRIGHLDILQSALKILINSGYGSISSDHNPIGDPDLSDAITVTGSSSIKQINEIAKSFIRNKLVDDIDEEIDEIDRRLNELGYEK